MKGIHRKLSPVILTVLLFAGCSRQPPSIDFQRAEADVNRLTVSLFGAISNGAEENAYQTLLDAKVKEKVSVGTFVTASRKIVSSLGALKSLDNGGRSDYDPYLGGWLARVTYVGHFEKGDGNIAISALFLNDQWRIMSFNVNSPLLYGNPADYRQRVELYVINSDLVMPGSHVKVVARNLNDKVLVEDAQVLYVRWKISATNAQEGFVTVVLSKEEEAAVKTGGELSVKFKN